MNLFFLDLEKKIEICIDELGWEASQKHIYGNDPSAIIASWIMERDKLFLETGLRTHYTTNLQIKNPDEPVTLHTLYGARTIDRLKADCNILNWEGGSLRK